MGDGMRGRSIDPTVPKRHCGWCLEENHSQKDSRGNITVSDNRQTDKFETNPTNRRNQFN